MNRLEDDIKQIIKEEILKLNRPDLYRAPLISFSSANDPRYFDLKTIIGQWHLTPKELLDDAKSVISYFVPFTKEVIINTKKATKETKASAKWGESYAVVNEYFTQMNNVICDYLQKEGYSACAIPGTHTYDPKDMKSMWSHRSAAVIGGMGTFGANRMLITEKGSAGRFCTVLTSAALKYNEDTPKTRCLYLKDGSCGLCFKKCPVKALTPNAIDRFACQAETKKNETLLETAINLQNADTCGKCIGVCPVAYIE